MTAHTRGPYQAVEELDEQRHGHEVKIKPTLIGRTDPTHKSHCRQPILRGRTERKSLRASLKFKNLRVNELESKSDSETEHKIVN